MTWYIVHQPYKCEVLRISQLRNWIRPCNLLPARIVQHHCLRNHREFMIPNVNTNRFLNTYVLSSANEMNICHKSGVNIVIIIRETMDLFPNEQHFYPDKTIQSQLERASQI